MRRRQSVQMAMIPIRALRHGLRNVVCVGVRHPARNVQHHVIGVSLGADMHAVDMQVERRGCHHRRVKRHLLALRRILGVEEIPDGEAGERVVEMDDQRLPRKHLQGRRGVQIVASHLPVRRRAADQLIGEHKHVLDWRRDGIEPGLALLGDQPHLQDAVLAREHDRLAEVGADRGIEVVVWASESEQGEAQARANAIKMPPMTSGCRHRIIFAPPAASLLEGAPHNHAHPATAHAQLPLR